MSKNLQTLFAAMTHLAEGLCFKALLMLKAESSLLFALQAHECRQCPRWNKNLFCPLKKFRI
jgi:hypothetical protein